MYDTDDRIGTYIRTARSLEHLPKSAEVPEFGSEDSFKATSLLLSGLPRPGMQAEQLRTAVVAEKEEFSAGIEEKKR